MAENLKELLQEVKPKLTEEDLKSKFKEIAEELFSNYYIEKNGIKYYFMELEFYYYSDNHKDFITYPRYAEAGDWFFHASGVDICFDSNLEYDENDKIISDLSKAHFGGILIRSLKKVDTNDNSKYLTGPHKCCYDLFDRFSAIDKTFKYPIIKKKEKAETTIDSCQRFFNFSISDEKKYKNIIDDNYKGIKIEASVEDFKKYINSDNDHEEYRYRWYAPDEFERWEKQNSKSSYNARPSNSYKHHNKQK